MLGVSLPGRVDDSASSGRIQATRGKVWLRPQTGQVELSLRMSQSRQSLADLTASVIAFPRRHRFGFADLVSTAVRYRVAWTGSALLRPVLGHQSVQWIPESTGQLPPVGDPWMGDPWIPAHRRPRVQGWKRPRRC